MYPINIEKFSSYDISYDNLIKQSSYHLIKIKTECSSFSLVIISFISLLITCIIWPPFIFLSSLHTCYFFFRSLFLISLKKTVEFPKHILKKNFISFYLFLWKIFIEFPSIFGYNRAYVALSFIFQKKRGGLRKLFFILIISVLGFSPSFLFVLDKIRYSLYRFYNIEIDNNKKNKIFIKIWYFKKELDFLLNLAGGENEFLALKRKIYSNPIIFNPNNSTNKIKDDIKKLLIKNIDDRMVSVNVGKKNSIGHLGFFLDTQNKSDVIISTTNPIENQTCIGIYGKKGAVITINNIIDTRLINTNTYDVESIGIKSGLYNEFFLNKMIIESWYLKNMLLTQPVIYQYPYNNKTKFECIKKGLYYESYLYTIQEKKIPIDSRTMKKIEILAANIAKFKKNDIDFITETALIFQKESLKRSGDEFTNITYDPVYFKSEEFYKKNGDILTYQNSIDYNNDDYRKMWKNGDFLKRSAELYRTSSVVKTIGLDDMDE